MMIVIKITMIRYINSFDPRSHTPKLGLKIMILFLTIFMIVMNQC